MTDIVNALITSSISIGLYGIYKLIQHYRVHSECNKNNELVISVVDIEKPEKPVDIEMEIKREINKEIQKELNKNLSV
jgi:hypothetical protein